MLSSLWSVQRHQAACDGELELCKYHLIVYSTIHSGSMPRISLIQPAASARAAPPILCASRRAHWILRNHKFKHSAEGLSSAHTVIPWIARMVAISAVLRLAEGVEVVHMILLALCCVNSPGSSSVALWLLLNVVPYISSIRLENQSLRSDGFTNGQIHLVSKVSV